MNRRNKKIFGWILVGIYFILPFSSEGWNSYLEFWDWLNIIFIIAIWELLIKDWLLKN